MEKGVKRRRRKGQCNQGGIIMLVQKSRSPKKKETERWSVVVTRRCWPGVAESVLACSSGGEGRGGARRRRRLGSARGGRTGAEAARVLCSAFGAGHCSINWRHGHRGTLLPNTAALAPALMQWDEHAATLHEGPMEHTPPARLPSTSSTYSIPLEFIRRCSSLMHEGAHTVPATVRFESRLHLTLLQISPVRILTSINFHSK
jgi:hypothetical protein